MGVQIAGTTEDALNASLEEALRVGILEDQSRGGALRFRFAHAFFRQTLCEELFSARWLRLETSNGSRAFPRSSRRRSPRPCPSIFTACR